MEREKVLLKLTSSENFEIDEYLTTTTKSYLFEVVLNANLYGEEIEAFLNTRTYNNGTVSISIFSYPSNNKTTIQISNLFLENSLSL